eukprot:2160260-Alexandrium_andersonii.AAC.1
MASSPPPPLAREAARGILSVAGLPEHAALEHALGLWLVEVLQARARRSGITQRQWNLTAWVWLLHKAGIVDAAHQDSDLFD